MSVSIVIPTYNSAAYLPATIRSALGQAAPAAEVIVVDDGSTDESASVCAPFLDRITYVQRSNQGVSAARNHGASLSRGEWLLFLDSDDILLPPAVGALLEAAARDSADVAYGHVLMRGRTPKETRLHGHAYAAGPVPVPALKNFWRSVITTPGSAIVRRSLHEKIGGFVPGYEPMEDRDYWIKCGTMSAFGYSDTCVLDKTFREGSAHTQAARRIWNGLRAQLAFLDWCREHGIDSGFLRTSPAGIVERALKDALWFKRWEILPPLLEKAREIGLNSFWYHRVRFACRLHSLFNKIEVPPFVAASRP